MYICNGPYSVFYLMHHKLLLNMWFGFARVWIKGIRISKGVLHVYFNIFSFLFLFAFQDFETGIFGFFQHLLECLAYNMDYLSS